MKSSWFYMRRMAWTLYDVATSLAGYRPWPPRVVFRDLKRREQVAR